MRTVLVAAVLYLAVVGALVGDQDVPLAAQVNDLAKQSEADVARKSAGCLTCHKPDTTSMHQREVRAGCTDCHGGQANESVPTGAKAATRAYDQTKRRAHVQPVLDIWPSSGANPVRAYAATNLESVDFIKFVNPGDLRVAATTCGQCHAEQVARVSKSMMRHGGMLWGAALYNNGAFPFKNAQFGEFYMPDGTPATAYTRPAPTARDVTRDGVLPSLAPLFRWELSQPGNLLRVFERGGRRPLDIGLPDPAEEPGRPANRLSNRGLGTLNRTDPVFIGLQKTRLLDPTLNFMGTNDQPGDYRSSGCTACHAIYANDRSAIHSGPYASAGNRGETQTSDPTIRRSEPGHPIRHVLTVSIPTSQCMVCHVHPGTNVMNSYLGVMWWDNETDGNRFYPATSLKRSASQRAEIEARNPEGSALKGLWGDVDFLMKTGTTEFNSQMTQTQLADFHGHGWLFRAVFKRDRKGNLLDDRGSVVPKATPAQLAAAVANTEKRARPGEPVHLKDIHLERGMHCADCHFDQDTHGNGKLYGDTRNAVAIACVDCHGTIQRRSTLATSGFAARTGGLDLTTRATPFQNEERPNERQLQFVFRDDLDANNPPVEQYSMVTQGLFWTIPQIADSVDPNNPRFNPRAARAKTIQRDGQTINISSVPSSQLAHANDRFTCQSCHTSWMTSCFGCHLSQKANEKKPMLHNEGIDTRNWTSYNFQVLRDDVFMLGIDGTTTGNRISPVRSSSAVLVSSEGSNRQLVYHQQQTVSSEGYAGQAFNPHVPHTVRRTETKTCTDCHVSTAGDNNAWLAQTLLQGTNLVNFMGRYVWVATGRSGVQAVEVTELDEPQAVIGSDLHRLAYPERFQAHERRGRLLQHAHGQDSTNALGVQARGEYLYIADGEGGFRVYDIAQVNQKDFSERIVSSPVSRFGQRTRVSTRFAAAIAAPSTLAIDPARIQRPQNEEQPIHDLYKYVYIADRTEGLVLSSAATLLDGNPLNNFLQRAATFNPNGLLNGALSLTIAGHYAYVLCDRGLVVLNLQNPLQPVVAAQLGAPIREPRALAIQFRYAFLVDRDGLKVIDVTVPEHARIIESASLQMANARSIYVARTYAYIAAGPDGVVIVDVGRPERPSVSQTFSAGGTINDAQDVKVAMTNASLFAYVADGRHGLRVLQLVSANATPGAFGFSPTPTPSLIATYQTDGPALSISKGLDRDRAVDESGHQVAVFGRRGARPFNLEETLRLYLRNGKLWTVDDQP